MLKSKARSTVKTGSSNNKLMKWKKPVNTEKFKKILAYTGPKGWDNLPESFHHVQTQTPINHKLVNLLRSKAKVKMKSNFTALTIKVQMSPLYRDLTLWDALPIDLQNEKDYNKHKLEIKKLDL